MLEHPDRLHYEAVVPSPSGMSMFAPDAPRQPRALDALRPPPEQMRQAAARLQELGLDVRHIGSLSVSGDAPRERWQEVFGTHVEQRTQPLSPRHPETGGVTYLSHVPDVPFTIPAELQGLVERAYPQPPPSFFASPLPPRVGYHHLRVPSDVAALLRATRVHQAGITGDGVRVAMTDSGFFRHSFYDWHGYRYEATLAPDAVDVEVDDEGHGTAEAANVFAAAPGVDFVGMKMGGNATLAFKAAAELNPAIITNSWGYAVLPGDPLLPNFLRPLEVAVEEAVRERGITVCFSAGNGEVSFPGMMPEVISVGGVYAHDTFAGGDFTLEASDYASSFASSVYPGRQVPDVCGLVGRQPSGVYIMLPVPPGSALDAGLAGPSFPSADETGPADGWAVLSGTSAASPQIAGVCALLLQAQPGLSPAAMKELLIASARDVITGRSAMEEPAGPGPDAATGAGLVDAHAAYLLARFATAPTSSRR